jgi:DNA-binding NarL/FixJ family response regulator
MTDDVVVMCRDLFFAMRIRNALKQMSYTARLVKSEEELAAQLADSESTPALLIIDFNSEVDWSMISDATASTPQLPTIAFGPHTDVASFRAAKAAGMTRVVANGTFTAELPALIETYARRS